MTKKWKFQVKIMLLRTNWRVGNRNGNGVLAPIAIAKSAISPSDEKMRLAFSQMRLAFEKSKSHLHQLRAAFGKKQGAFFAVSPCVATKGQENLIMKV